MEAAVTDSQVWAIIVISSAFTIAVIILLWTRGGSVGLGTTKTGSIGIFIPEKWRKANPMLDVALDCMSNELRTIRKQKRDAYTDALKEAGIPEHVVTAHEDYAFYDQCLGNIIWSGNGIRSFKSVLEMEIVHGSYVRRRRESEMDKYISALIERLHVEEDTYLDRSYLSQVVTDSGGHRLRKVSREMLREMETKSQEDMFPVLKRMFVAMQDKGCKE